MSEVIVKAQELAWNYGPSVIAALAILVLGWLAAKVVRAILRGAMRKARVDETLTGFCVSVAYVGFMVFVALAALGQLGVQTTSFVAIIGAAGLAIALAFQGTLSNLSAGVMLIIFRPIKPGDFVEAAGTSGIVETIEVFTTTMRTPDNRVIYIPNARIIGDVITNYSVKETRRIDLEIGVGYDDELGLAKTTLERILAEEERILEEPAVTVGVLSLGDSSVNFAVRPWVKASDYWSVRFALLQGIKEEFDKVGISIPYPQTDVHIQQAKAA
jgi:small conductance mechanosensitive channel